MLIAKRLLSIAVAIVLFSTALGCCRKHFHRDTDTSYAPTRDCQEPCNK